MRIAILIGSILTSMSVPAGAVPPVTPPAAFDLPANGTAKFDIAGVRVGMSPDDVRKAMVKAGYRVGVVSRLESFGGQVAARIAELRHQSRIAKYDTTWEIQATGPATESLTVDFDQWPDGPHAVVLSFRANPDRQSQDAFRSQVEARYGKPTGRALGVWRWCSPGERQCGPVAIPALPSLDADYQMRSLHLKIGADAAQARKALVEAEARKVVPLQDGSAF